MIKIICDKCKSEIESVSEGKLSFLYILNLTTEYPFRDIKYWMNKKREVKLELCEGCFDEIMNNKKI